MCCNTHLEELYLGGCTSVTDIAIVALGTYASHLVKLSLSETQCTDDSLPILATRCTKLVWLALDSCGVSFVAVSKLTGGMTQLQHLSLHNCPLITARSVSLG